MAVLYANAGMQYYLPEDGTQSMACYIPQSPICLFLVYWVIVYAHADLEVTEFYKINTA